jgi:hypothetical protein
MGTGNAQAADKPCICHVKKRGWPWKATGQVNAQQQSEFKCRICGATTWS